MNKRTESEIRRIVHLHVDHALYQVIKEVQPNMSIGEDCVDRIAEQVTQSLTLMIDSTESAQKDAACNCEE